MFKLILFIVFIYFILYIVGGMLKNKLLLSFNEDVNWEDNSKFEENIYTMNAIQALYTVLFGKWLNYRLEGYSTIIYKDYGFIVGATYLYDNNDKLHIIRVAKFIPESNVALVILFVASFIYLNRKVKLSLI